MNYYYYYKIVSPPDTQLHSCVSGRGSCLLLRSFSNKLLSSVLQLSRRVYVPLKLAASHVTVSRKMPRCLMPTYTAGSY